MENKVVNLEIKNNIDDVTKQVKKLSNSFEDTSKDIKDIQKSTKSAEGGVNSLSSGFKGMGLAIKAIGIGLVMEAFNMFKDVLSKNQKVVDFFNTAIGALSIAFNDLIGFVLKKFPAVIKIFKDVFENPTTYLKSFGDLIKENLTERFESFLDTIGYVGEALKKVFEGDFKGAMESVKKAGKESLDVLTGVNNTFDKGKKAVTDITKSITDYAVSTYKASAANIALQNSALLAAAEQGRLVEQYDREAEKLRQTRDDVRLTVEERIKANDKLNTVLDKQEASMTKQAAMQVAAAQATNNLNNTIENQVALVEALSNAEGVLAQITGLRSEQQTNEAGLTQELNDLTRTRQETITELAVNERNFNAERVRNEALLLQAKKEALKENEIDELKRLKNVIKNANAGTQAKVDAEKEFLLKQQEFRQQGILIDDEIAELKRIKDVEKQQLLIDNDLLTFETKRNALIEQERLLLEDSKLSEEERLRIKQEYKNRGDAIEQAQFDLKISLWSQTANALGGLSAVFKKGTAAAKAAALAEIAIGSAVGLINGLDIAQKSAKGTGPAAAFAFPLFYATQVAAVFGAVGRAKSILGGAGGNSSPSLGGGASSVSAPVATAAPSFNVVGTSANNQIAQTLGRQQDTPIKAYVVSKDITTAQSLDRNIITSATLG